MAAVLLVGVSSPFLRILATVLSHGWTVSVAGDEASLQESLASTRPAIVVFEHTQPFDLYELNPRRFGFAGPIVVIADEPGAAPSELRTEVLLRRPSDLLQLCSLMSELTEGFHE